MSAAEVAHRRSSTATPDGRPELRLAGVHDATRTAGHASRHASRRMARERATRDLRRAESRFALVAGSRTGTAPVIELRPRSSGAARPKRARAVELTLVLSAVAIAVTLALLPGPAVTGSSGPHAGVPRSCASAAAAPCR